MSPNQQMSEHHMPDVTWLGVVKSAILAVLGFVAALLPTIIQIATFVLICIQIWVLVKNNLRKPPKE